MVKRLKIACTGEAMLELSLDGALEPAQVGIAGDTLKAAIYMQRALGAQHQVSFVSQ